MFDELGLDSSRYSYPRRFNLLHGNTAKGVYRHQAIQKVKRWMEPWFQVIYSRTTLSSRRVQVQSSAFIDKTARTMQDVRTPAKLAWVQGQVLYPDGF